MDLNKLYETLKGQGLMLPEEDFIQVMQTISQGAKETLDFLGETDSAWPKFEISDRITVLGYDASKDVICFSIRHLNHIFTNATPLIYKDQLVCFIPDTFYIIIKYLSFLSLLGRESTVHRYQKLGNHMLHKPFPASFPQGLSLRLLLLSDYEIEARTIVDAIAKRHEEITIWQNVDEYFQKTFPDYYNKPVADLATMQKPDLPISYELESFGI